MRAGAPTAAGVDERESVFREVPTTTRVIEEPWRIL